MVFDQLPAFDQIVPKRQLAEFGSPLLGVIHSFCRFDSQSASCVTYDSIAAF